MIEREIDELKRKMDKQISDNRPYEEIYETSVEIDKLLVKYYKETMSSKNVLDIKK